MKCKECEAAVKGFFGCRPDEYVCIGVKEPFVISDINVECTQYSEKRKEKTMGKISHYRVNGKDYTPYIDDDGIYMPNAYNENVYYQLVMTKELFVEAYNKWIKNESVINFIGIDDADDWSED